MGSPHTPDGYIWHIGLCVQLLTSRSEEEVARLFGVLRDTDAGTLQMHEGFDCNDPENTPDHGLLGQILCLRFA